MRKKTFTKKWVKIILIVSLIDMQIPFILAMMGREQIAETLAITIVTEIIGVMSGYFLKSYFETKQEKLMDLEEIKLEEECEESDG